MTYPGGVVVLASQKGGSGKTTLSGHLAVEAERAGDGPVALIDTDPQGSLAKWWNARAAPTPLFAQVMPEDLAAGIAALRASGVRLIVIDTPPSVTETIADVVAHGDLIVVPTRPSPHDLRAVGPTVDIVERCRKALVFVVNSATARARITAETAVALSQHGVVAPVTLHHRVDFAASMIDGRTVGEVREGSRSAVEVTALWTYLRDRLARVEGRAATLADVVRPDFTVAVLTPAAPADMAATEAAEPEPEPADTAEAEVVHLPPAPAEPPVVVPPLVKPGFPAIPRFLSRLAPRPEPFPEPAFEMTHVEPLSVASRIAAIRAQSQSNEGHAAEAPMLPPQLEAAVEAALRAAPAPVIARATANGGWDGIERRGADRGPPTGEGDRRRASVFGRRHTQGG